MLACIIQKACCDTAAVPAYALLRGGVAGLLIATCTMAEDRAAILQILRETKPGLPDYSRAS